METIKVRMKRRIAIILVISSISHCVIRVEKNETCCVRRPPPAPLARHPVPPAQRRRRRSPPPLSPPSPLPSPSSIVSDSQSHRSVTGICNWYHFRGNQKKTLINMRRVVAVATGGGGSNNGGTEGWELFEGIIVVGHQSSVPPL